MFVSVFFFNDTATAEIYTLSLHDALPICSNRCRCRPRFVLELVSPVRPAAHWRNQDRKSTRLNSSHMSISYAVFCLKKKNQRKAQHSHRTRPTNPHAKMALSSDRPDAHAL